MLALQSEKMFAQSLRSCLMRVVLTVSLRTFSRPVNSPSAIETLVRFGRFVQVSQFIKFFSGIVCRLNQNNIWFRKYLIYLWKCFLLKNQIFVLLKVQWKKSFRIRKYWIKHRGIRFWNCLHNSTVMIYSLNIISKWLTKNTGWSNSYPNLNQCAPHIETGKLICGAINWLVVNELTCTVHGIF